VHRGISLVEKKLYIPFYKKKNKIGLIFNVRVIALEVKQVFQQTAEAISITDSRHQRSPITPKLERDKMLDLPQKRLLHVAFFSGWFSITYVVTLILLVSDIINYLLNTRNYCGCISFTHPSFSCMNKLVSNHNPFSHLNNLITFYQFFFVG